MFQMTIDVKQELNTEATVGGKEASSEGVEWNLRKWR